MKIRKPLPPQGNSLKEKGLIFQILDKSAKDFQEKTGVDYTTAWHNQIQRFAGQSDFKTDNPAELKKWIFSLPLGKFTLLQEQPIPLPFSSAETTAVEKEICSPEEAFASIQSPPPWDELAAFLSIFAEKVYQPEDVVKSFVQDQGGDAFCWFTDKVTSATAFGCVMHGHPVLCFRGTHTLRQLIIDVLILPWGRPIRHMGFSLAWGVIKKQVTGWLNSISFDQGVILTGHSLGGAMAFLAAYDLSEFFRVGAIITFGAPRPAMAGFRDRYSDRWNLHAGTIQPLGRMTYRYTHETDLVSRIPPPILFSHVVSNERLISNDGSIEERLPPSYIQRIEAISTKAMALSEMLFGTTSGFSQIQGPRSTRESLEILLLTFPRFLIMGIWGIYFLSCFLLSLLIPLTLIDAFRHKTRAYVEAFSKRFEFIGRL